MPPRIAIVTLAVGADYRKALAKGLESKRLYAERHGYDFHLLGEEAWDRDRPFSWSKVPLAIRFLQDTRYDFVFLSDADTMITNLSLRIEDHLLPVLGDKDFLMTWDSCGTPNAGSVLIRRCDWAIDFWKRVWDQTEFLYHIWWEQGAILTLFQTNPQDAEHLQLIHEPRRFNAFLKGLPDQPLWQPGDFLVHLAGVYQLPLMEYLLDQISQGKTPRLTMENAVIQ